MHPSNEVSREYAVRILGDPDAKTIEKLKKGVRLEDGLARFDSIEAAGGAGANRWFNVVLKEGRNREVRRIWEAVGITVSRLMRVRFGSIRLPDRLGRGRYANLTKGQITTLYKSPGLVMPTQPAPPKRPPLKAPSSLLHSGEFSAIGSMKVDFVIQSFPSFKGCIV